jgi:type IV pilus assembly protein PilX
MFEHNPDRPTPRQGNKGIALVSVMLLMLIVTVLGLAMFRRVTAEERVAGSVREHQRSFEAAQNALQRAENWLTVSYTGEVALCAAGEFDASNADNIRVCDMALTTPLSLSATAPWSTRFTFTPPGMVVSATGGDGTTSQIPGFYVRSLGLAPDGRTQLYQVLSYGFGGSSAAVTVLQSTYALSAKVTSLDNP